MEKSYERKKTLTLILNGLIAAIYLVLTIVVTPVSQGVVQFRISEGLNHLVVFNKKLMWGVFLGVILFNLFFSDGGLLDVLFGGGQTLLALSLTAYLEKWIKNTKWLMVCNTLIFSVSMVLIDMMICIIGNQPIGSSFFWVTYGSLFLSELIVMSISAPIMFYVNKFVKFDKY